MWSRRHSKNAIICFGCTVKFRKAFYAFDVVNYSKLFAIDINRNRRLCLLVFWYSNQHVCCIRWHHVVDKMRITMMTRRYKITKICTNYKTDTSHMFIIVFLQYFTNNHPVWLHYNVTQWSIYSGTPVGWRQLSCRLGPRRRLMTIHIHSITYNRQGSRQ